VLTGAAVVVDVSNSPSFEDGPVLEFFRTATTNLLARAADAGVGHYVALSVVGTDRMAASGDFPLTTRIQRHGGPNVATRRGECSDTAGRM
jgi:uncharacterized protein YbjT (DUF2867 family)